MSYLRSKERTGDKTGNGKDLLHMQTYLNSLAYDNDEAVPVFGLVLVRIPSAVAMREAQEVSCPRSGHSVW